MTDKQQLALVEKLWREARAAQKPYSDKPIGPHWRNAEAAYKKLKADMTPKPNKVPALGPVVKGGSSVLLHDCTHMTDGVGWPAYDDMGAAGTPVLAPEKIMIYDNTSGAQGGDAFYGRGASGMRYWFGHIAEVPRQFAVFEKGQVMTHISRHHPAPHCHVGIDAKPLIGHALISHTDYTHGAPTIGVQLARALNT